MCLWTNIFLSKNIYVNPNLSHGLDGRIAILLSQLVLHTSVQSLIQIGKLLNSYKEGV